MANPSAPTKAISKARRFRWRTIPVAFVAVFGIFLFLSGLFAAFIMTYTTFTDAPLYSPGPSGYSKQGLSVCVWGMGCGCYLILCAIQWWKGRWRLALAMVAVCFLIAALLSVAGIAPD
jgi:hypothetical protein